VLSAPFFDQLEVGEVFDAAPALTIGPGHAALHQAIVGDRLRLALDAELCRVVTGGEQVVHPALVCDVAIGQSTVATQRVIANLFYRGLVLRRAVRIGDTLRSSVEVVGLRQNRQRPGRAATGLAALRVRTHDQEGREVLDFWRCAMLPLRDPEGTTDRADDLDRVGAEGAARELDAAIAGWDLAAYRRLVPGGHLAGLEVGQTWQPLGGDVVSAAPALARLGLNLAVAHHDAEASADGRRLVYGGHTIGLACAQLCRALPELVTVLAWHSCDHLAPVFEGDTLRSRIELERLEPLAGGGGIAHLRVQSRTAAAEVLDWRLAAAMA
jgi:acyl dehydratase